MVRDLVGNVDRHDPRERLDEVADRAEQAAEERVLDLLLPPAPAPAAGTPEADLAAQREQTQRTRENCACNCGKASWISGWWTWKFASGRCLRSKLFEPGHGRDGRKYQGHAQRIFRTAEEKTQDERGPMRLSI